MQGVDRLSFKTTENENFIQVLCRSRLVKRGEGC